MGKTLCQKVKGHDSGKRRGKERKGRGSRKRTRRVDTYSTDSTKKKTPILDWTQQKRLIKEKKKKKKQSSDGI